MSRDLVRELAEWIAIPSVSADPARASDVERAGAWLAERIQAAGGRAELVNWDGQPLVVGEIAASTGTNAPTVLCYGHFDVQSVEPLELWESDPYALEERDGWLYGRGVADDKGQLIMLLDAARSLSRDGQLPVNARFVCDGEEETGGQSIVDFLAADEGEADTCLIFDTGMIERDLPAFTIATRGLAYLHLELRSGERDLHSGEYGGAALNALHALVETLSAVLPRAGRLPEPLLAGVTAPSDEEQRALAMLPPGEHVLAAQGARPSDPKAAERFYLRTVAEPALDVHGIAGGSARLQKTVLPVTCEANLSLRIAPGQNVEQLSVGLERLLRDAAPAGADVKLDLLSASPPALVPPDSPAIRLGLDAFERAFGRRPILVRSGGTLPVMAALAAKSIPAIVTGFDLPEGNIHSPNERLLAAYLERGVTTAKELLTALAALGDR